MNTTAEQTANKTGFIPAFVIAYSDSDFTNPHEVVLPDEPKDCRGDFTHMGAKYWGLETRRHKATSVKAAQQVLQYDHDAHNWFTIGLKQRAQIDRITCSTKWYTGNQVRAISVLLIDELTGKETSVLDRVSLNPDQDHEFTITPTAATECRIECYYEGGISQVNFFGQKTAEQLPQRKNVLEGVPITHVSNMHYGKPDQAVVGNRLEMHMLGWESARTGFGERALFHLDKPTVIEEVVVDTYLHRLNAPLTAHVFAVKADAVEIDELMGQAPRWKLVFHDGKEVIPDDFQKYMLEQEYLKEKVADPKHFHIMLHTTTESRWLPIVPFEELRPDTYHRFKKIADKTPITHLLYMHYPNGGIHGLKVFGSQT